MLNFNLLSTTHSSLSLRPFLNLKLIPYVFHKPLDLCIFPIDWCSQANFILQIVHEVHEKERTQDCSM